MWTFEVSDPKQTQALGQALSRYLKAGDLVMLSGGLGSGKTTFTQGIGKGLGVRGAVASPTFIVARVHPPLNAGGVPLIHADAYRIDSVEDLETLDLDSSLADSVTVVEWGEGKTEGLSRSRLEISITRPRGAAPSFTPGQVVDLEDLDDGKRIIQINPIGQRWEAVDMHLDSALAPAPEEGDR